MRWIFHIAATAFSMIFLARCRYPYRFGVAGLGRGLCCRFGLRRCFCLRTIITRGSGTVTGRIVDSYTRLNIIAIDIETDSFSVILYGICFDLDTAAHEIVPLKYGGEPVCDMMLRFFYVVCNHVFKRKHSFDVHVSGAGNQVFSIGIFGGELPSDQMTAIPQVSAGDAIIFCLNPSGGLNAADVTTGFVCSRHCIPAESRSEYFS